MFGKFWLYIRCVVANKVTLGGYISWLSVIALPVLHFSGLYKFQEQQVFLLAAYAVVALVAGVVCLAGLTWWGLETYNGYLDTINRYKDQGRPDERIVRRHVLYCDFVGAYLAWKDATRHPEMLKTGPSKLSSS